MDFSIGQVVISKAGRDKGDVFIVFDVLGEYLHLVDGRARPIANPKKKKTKHVQPTHTISTTLQQAITGRQYIKDSDFRNALNIFKGNREDN